MTSLRVRSVAGAIACVCLLVPAGSAAGRQKPALDPGIAEGIALHDRGEYDKAIARFQEVLARDPGNTAALYEMALSHYAKKDYRKVIEIGEKALALPHADRADFYMMIGNAKDDLGDAEGAMSALLSGVRENPNHSRLRYNLAIAYLNQKKLEEARPELERDVALDPTHTSGHFYLAKVYQAQGYLVPALLAYCRFLVLEPTTGRSRDAVANIERLFASRYSVATGKDGKPQINITFDAGAKKDEGDFATVELMIGLGQAPALALGLEKSGNPTVSKVVDLITSLKLMAPSKGFAVEYYVPYFKGLAEQKLETTFANAIVLAGAPEGREWLSANQTAIQDLVKWSESYAWPKR